MKNPNCTYFHKNCLSRNRLRILLVVVLLPVLLIALLGYHYKSHLLWKYVEWRYDLYAENTIPVLPMPEVEIPDDWIEHSCGNLRFRLPPNFILKEEDRWEAMGPIISITLFNDSYRIHGRSLYDDFVPDFSVLEEGLWRNELLKLVSSKQDLRKYFPDSKEPLSFPSLRLECCLVGANKFRWSMSSNEVEHNTFFIILRSCINVYPAKAETFFRDDVYGLNLFKTNSVQIDWKSTSTNDEGYIHVIDYHNSSELDVDLARRISKSIRIVLSDLEDVYNIKNSKPEEQAGTK